jgi:tetratricopeptide (TPR) repeat protein
MSDRVRRTAWIPLIIVVLAIVVTPVVLLRRSRLVPGPLQSLELPKPGSAAYDAMVSAFYAGVAALDADAAENAERSLTRATELVPGEPAAWANRGLLAIRSQRYDAGANHLERARSLAPDSSAVMQLLGLLESRRGRLNEAIAYYRKSIDLAPGNLKASYALAESLTRLNEADRDREAVQVLTRIVEKKPDNLVALLELARLAGKVGDAAALRAAVERMKPLAPGWPTRARDAYAALDQAAKADLSVPAARREAGMRVVPIKNSLVQAPVYRRSLAVVDAPVGTIGEPIEHFLKMEPPPPTPSPPDEALAFAYSPVAVSTGWDTAIAVSLTGPSPPAIFAANGREARRIDAAGSGLAFPGGGAASPPSSHGLLAVDLNSDYRMDLVLAGAGGVRIFRQAPDETFADATTAAKLDAEALNANLFGAWTADIEMDGDLDVVLGAREGPTRVLRNNGDGTFRVTVPFEGSKNLRDFAWADFDRDGDPDAALLDSSGALQVFSNERASRFVPRSVPKGVGKLAALAAADINGDFTVDLLALKPDGAVVRLTDKDDGEGWDVVSLGQFPKAVTGAVRLGAADLDNNGSVDVFVGDRGATWVGLTGGPATLSVKEAPGGLHALAAADLNGDGQLDLAGLSPEGRVVRAVGQGTRKYHWQIIRPRAARVVGDGRINSFGVGGEVELRAGLLAQKQVITGPLVHFGLGDHTSSDVARIIWPNGSVQGEFDARADQTIVAEQRLKGSCPFLHAFNGTSMEFVTDVIWRSPLGLRINAQDTAGVMQTEDWVKIRGDQLAEREGYYDLSVTAELWETHYFDQFGLMVVDHPAGTEVFVDERFARTPPALKVHVTGPVRPLAHVRDHHGRDVSAVVAQRDGRYLDTFGRGFYQGVTRDHWVEAELGDDVPPGGPLALVAFGWIHPTDSSLNVAIGQGSSTPPRGLSLEVATADGGWAVARDDLGFPAGKNKTIVIDVTDVFRPNAPRRFRLRTNLEVYWDSLAVALPKGVDTLKTQRLAPASAVLRSRGFSRMSQADASSPELPEYGTVTGTAQRWRDLIGYYTRFGDVRELIEKVDDRYVIANAGDELALRFPAPGAPAPGWVRDFVMIADGWNKDGDYNTGFSKTVLPLPSHAQAQYDRPPGALEDDPVYRFHQADWETYHTRYITPSTFQDGLAPRRAPAGWESSR